VLLKEDVLGVRVNFEISIDFIRNPKFISIEDLLDYFKFDLRKLITWGSNPQGSKIVEEIKSSSYQRREGYSVNNDEKTSQKTF
jgi:hypothetical protein